MTRIEAPSANGAHPAAMTNTDMGRKWTEGFPDLPEGNARTRIGVILRKEWLELRGERGLILGTVLPPLFFTLLPVLLALAVGVIPHESSSALVPPPSLGSGMDPGAGSSAPIISAQDSGLDLRDLRTQALEQAIIGSQFSLLFLLLPIIVPAVIASYSIVGEKTGRTLEPLLAAPIHVGELLLGKALAAFLPAVGITWAGALVFGLGMWAVSVDPIVVSRVVTAPWVLSVLLVAPLMSLIAIGLTVAVSARVRDPRTAQQISAVLILPIIGVVLGRISGLLTFNTPFVLAWSAVLAVIALAVGWVAARAFKREAILTRWS